MPGLMNYVRMGCLAIGVVAAGSLVAQEYVADGLTAFWTFDKDTVQGDTLKDVLGKNDAKIMGKPKSVAGVIGEAFEFDGGPNYVEIPKLGAWEQGSIECWAMEGQFGAIQGIVSTWQWVAGKVHFKFESNQIQVDKNGGVKIVSPAEVNKWYHIVYTADTAANKLKLYVNGAFVVEGVAGAAPQNMDERRIGSEHDGRFLIGKVDEVRLYQRILTDAEVKQNFGVKSNVRAVSPGGKATMTWASVKREASR